jgi:CspA family cold shock protein
MASGTIASLRDRGFGFIMPDGASGRGDLFFHRSAVGETSFDLLREGQRVSFEEAPDPRDPSRRRAVNVRLVEDEAEDLAAGEPS